MRSKPLMAAMVVVLSVGACGTIRDSRLNPLNWFGRSQQQQAVVLAPGMEADGRSLVDQIIHLSVEPTSDGAIVRAIGLPPTQGWWEGELILEPTETEGDLVYRFVVAPPPDTRRVSTPQSREVTVAAFLSTIRLQTVRRITVTGANNSRSTTRR